VGLGPPGDGTLHVVVQLVAATGLVHQGSLARVRAVVLGTSDDQNNRVIRTVMAAANRFTDMSMPASRRDVPGALTLWEALLGLGLPEHENTRIRRTMMGVAAMLTDLRVPGRELDVDGAILIWRAAHDHTADDRERFVVARTMEAVAERLQEAGDGAAAERLRQAAAELRR